MSRSSGILFAILGVILATSCSDDQAIRVREAREIGVVTQSKLFVGRDGGGSAVVWGKSVWSFGDSVTSVKDVEGETWHHNSFSFTDDLAGADGITLAERTDAAGAPAYFLAPTEDEAAFNVAHRGDPCKEQPCGARFAVWPGAPVFDAARNRALIPHGLISAAPGELDFHGVGQSFAVWTDFAKAPERPVVAPGTKHPTILFAEGEAPYGMVSVIDGEFLYGFGCFHAGWDFHCPIGRVALDHVFERSAWRFWDGGSWSESIAAAKPVLDASSIVSVHFNAYLKSWTAIYSAVLSNDVMLRTAPALTGPWSEASTIYTTDRKGKEGNTYDTYVHPEYSEENGRVLYLTHSRPTEGWFGSELALVRVVLE